MGDEVPPEPQSIDTGGGAAVHGSVTTGGGEFVGRDKNVYYQLDVLRLVEALRQALPSDDPAPDHLLDTLTRFQYFHTRLFEWKELHNFLNDVIFTLDQFAREVERLDASGQPGEARALARLWRPVDQKVTVMLDWAATVQHIAAKPFIRLPEGGLQGPAWAVETHTARLRIGELFQPRNFDLAGLYDATHAFMDVVERHLYLADKSLRDTAMELYHLSSIVLGSVKHG